jgi:hypothetical protein
VVLSSGECQVTARAPAESRIDFDTPVWFRFREGKLHRFDSSGNRM